MESESKKEAINENEEEEAEARVDIWKYVFGFAEMAVVKCAIDLGIAEVLENQEEPMVLSKLSKELGCSPSALYRIMRFLIHRGIFKEKPTSQDSIGYAQTPLSRLLMKNGKKSMATFVLFESSPVMLSPWLSLSGRVLAGESSAFEVAHGDDIWGYAAKHPAHSKLFDDMMASDARVIIPEIIERCPEVFKGLSSVVDVGGGDGTTLRILVKAFPSIRGICFDLPHVVSVAPKCDGVEHVEGDMFVTVPKANAAFLKWVLHDWGDDECIHILKKCKEAIPEEGGKVIIVEAIIDEKKGDYKSKNPALLMDMVMMAHTNTGKERTADEWAFVLREAGFKRHIIKQIQAMQSVIEAYP